MKIHESFSEEQNEELLKLFPHISLNELQHKYADFNFAVQLAARAIRFPAYDVKYELFKKELLTNENI
jgi:hypothetical protein